MSLNHTEIDLILSELDLPGSRVQDIVQPDFCSLVLTLYKPGGEFALLISLAADASRLHACSSPPARPNRSRRFVELLRSRVRNSRIAQVAQIHGERIVRLELTRAGESLLLWIRLWGPASNIILSEPEGTIIDAFYRRPKRGEISGGRYAPPAPRAQEEQRIVRSYPAAETSFNAFIDASYRAAEERSLLERLRSRLAARSAMQETKLTASLKNLSLRLDDYRDAERHKAHADLVLAGLSRIVRGDRSYEAEDWAHGGRRVLIPLDPGLSPAANAEALYERYRRAKTGRELVEREIEHQQAALEALRRDTRRLLEEGCAQELAEILNDGQRSEAAKKTAPGLRFSSAGHLIYVGRTATENDELLRRHLRGNDLWLHTRDCPGAYVFVKARPGKSIPLDVLLDAGTLAVQYSKARASGSAELYYTQVKHLRRAKGKKRGTVLPTHEKNLSVRIDPQRLERLKDSGAM